MPHQKEKKKKKKREKGGCLRSQWFSNTKL
jgi:hypothetical protein